MGKSQTQEEAAAELKAAEDTLATLEQKHRDKGARLAAIATEREGLALQAHTDGGQASTRLKALTREFAEAQIESEDLASAIKQARRNINRARFAVEATTRRANASKILELADAYERAGTRAHEAFLAAFAAIQEAQGIGDQVRSLGGAAPEWFSFIGNLDRALARYRLSIMAARLVRDLPPPGQRQPLDVIFKSASNSIRERAKAAIAVGTEAA